MSVNQQKINVYFERMTEMYGINGAGKIHRALLIGEVTPAVRSQIRKMVAQPQVKPTQTH